MPKLAAAIRHLLFEDLGCFAPVLEAAGYTLHYVDAGVDDLNTAAIEQADLLVVLGGPIGAYQEQEYPFLQTELALLDHRMRADRPTLGICLGAQLMTRALGAEVVPGPRPEIGFAPLTLTDAGMHSPIAAFQDAAVLHWHGDVFGLPDGAERLASTEACHNQAFSVGPNILGAQFHPEAAGDRFERWLIGHAAQLAAEGEHVPTLRSDHAQLAPQLRTNAEAFMRSWLARLTG